MANTLKFKRRVSGSPGAPTGLNSGEPAYNMVDKFLYIGFGDDGNGLATSTKAFAADDFIVNVPGGGTSGQVLSKSSNTSGDIGWTNVATYSAGTGLTLNAGTFAVNSSVVAFLASPAFTGSPTAPTQTAGDNTTKLATTAYVFNAVSGKLDASTAAATYAPINSPTFTGTPSLTTTPSPGDNSAKLASTAYVDIAVGAAKQSMFWKDKVRVVSLSNITLSGTQTIDGITVAVGDRVLVAGQTTGSQNGIYVVSSGAWTRATDMDTWAEVPGATVMVDEGSYAEHGFTCSNNTSAGGTLGTTTITFVEFTGATSLIAGNGIIKNGNTISVQTTGNGITVSASGVALAGNTLALANLTGASDTGFYFTVVGTLATYSLTAYGRSLNASTDASAARTTLGLGTMATQNASAVAITGGSINNITLDGGTF